MPTDFVTLDDAKAYLRVEHTADDALITSLLTVAMESAENVLGQSVPWQERDADGELVVDDDDEPVMVDIPQAVRHAVYLMVYRLYEDTRNGDNGTLHTAAVMALLQPYRLNVGI